MTAKDGWTTSHELDFVEKLGTHSDHGRAIGGPELRRRYAEAIKHRVRWGGIKRSAVLAELAP